MLKRLRRIAAVLICAVLLLVFLDFTGTLYAWLDWVARIQFVPALMALNVGVVLALVIVTLLMGRIYCSVICPLGVFQDAVSWVASRRKRNRFRYTPAKSWLRYGMFVIFVVSMVAGVGAVVTLLDPYAAFGRMVTAFVAPLYDWANNLLALLAERFDNYLFYSTEVWLKSVGLLVVAGVTLVALVILAWRGGRTYCNTICPVGTLLGFVSRYALLKIRIDTAKCTNCGLCGRNCKASCINTKEHTIDYSRCVDCFDCIGKCRQGAICFGLRPKEVTVAVASETIEPAPAASSADEPDSPARRTMLLATSMVVVSSVVRAQQQKMDGGLAYIADQKIPHRATPILPPGAGSARHFTQHCTGCQLCVAACPNRVLRPASKVDRFMQPEMSYERGYCRPECVRCSQVCPAGAIRPITAADKSAIQIGHAVWIEKNCIVLRDDVSCGNCARHCPTGAIQMVPRDAEDPASPKIPVINVERCIGCGACEHLCPSRPFSAIYVEGHAMHRTV